MPVFPGQSQMISTDVPGPQTNLNAGLVSTQIGSLGEQIARSSMMIYDKIQQAQASDSVAAARSADDSWSTAFKTDLLQKYPGGYVKDATGNLIENTDPRNEGQYKTITQAYRDAANERYQANVEALPNPIAKQIYRRDGSTFFTDEMNRVFGHELANRAATSKFSDQVLFRSIDSRLMDTPGMYDDPLNPQKDNGLGMRSFYKSLDDTIVSIQDKIGHGIYTPEEGNQILQKAMENRARANADGMLQVLADQARSGDPSYNSMKEIQNAIAVFQERDRYSEDRRRSGKPTLSTALSTEEKNRYIHQLLSMGKSNVKLDVSNWETEISNSKGIAKVRGINDAIPLYLQALNHGQKFTQTKQLTENEVITKTGDILSEGIAAEFKKPSFASQPFSVQDQLVETVVSRNVERLRKDLPESEGSNVVGGKLIGEGIPIGQSQVASNRAAYKQDSAQYVLDSNPALKARFDKLANQSIQQWNRDFAYGVSTVDKLVKHTDPMAVTSWRVVPKDFSNMVGSRLMDPATGNPEVKAAMAARMHELIPRQWDSFVEQMMKDGAGYDNHKVGYEFQYLKQMPNLSLAKRFFATLQTDESVLKKNFDASYAAKSENMDFNKFRNSALSDPGFQGWYQEQLSKHSGDPANDQRLAAYQNFFVNDSARIYVSKGGKLNAEDAAKDSFQALIGNQYTVKQSSRGGYFSPDERTAIFRAYPKMTVDGVDLGNDQVLNLLENQIKEHSNADYYRSLKILPPQDYVDRAMRSRSDGSQATKEQVYRQFYEMLGTRGTWHVDGQKGWIIKYSEGYDKGDRVAPYKDPVTGALVPVVVPFSELYKAGQPSPKAPLPPMSPEVRKKMNEILPKNSKSPMMNP